MLLLQKAGLANEAEMVINEGLNFNNIRNLKVDMLLKQDRHAAAIELVKEGIRLSNGKNLPGLVNAWEVRLLDIYFNSALLVKKVSDYADRNLGRKHYEYVAGIIGKLRSYPHGNGLADKLLVEFRAKYQVRRAMMEELNGV